MSWLTLLKYGGVAAAIIAVIYWISDQRYDAGYLAGYNAGVEAATKATNEYRDALEDRLRAERETTAAKKLAEVEKEYRERELKYAAERLASQLKAAQSIDDANHQRDLAVEQLRGTRADRQTRAGSCNPGLPKAPGASTAEAVSPGLLSERSEERIIRRAADAERLNIWFQQCTAELERLRGR